MTRILITVATLALMAVSPLSAEVYLSHNLFLDVQSSSDGNGNFSYSFTGSSDNPDFGFYFSDGLGTISILATGVEAVYAPPDWQGLVTSDGLVTFQYTGLGGVWIQNTPVIFSLNSSIFATKVYDSVGETSAPFTEFGNPNNGGWGTEAFSYLGPVPEPSAKAVFMLGTGILACAAWRSSRVAKPPKKLEMEH
jgi:hypothetical protein